MNKNLLTNTLCIPLKNSSIEQASINERPHSSNTIFVNIRFIKFSFAFEISPRFSFSYPHLGHKIETVGLLKDYSECLFLYYKPHYMYIVILHIPFQDFL